PLPDSFVHAEWITLHDNPDFRAFVDFLRSELDAAGPARAAVARAYFDRTVQLELDFFEQIYSRSTACGSDGPARATRPPGPGHLWAPLPGCTWAPLPGCTWAPLPGHTRVSRSGPTARGAPAGPHAHAPAGPSSADQHTGDRRAHQVRQGAGEDGAQTQLGDLGASLGGQPAQTAEQDAQGGQVREAGQGEGGDGGGLVAEGVDLRPELAE